MAEEKELVWAKMKGFSPWPGFILHNPPMALKKMKKTESECVFFFGTRNFAWIEKKSIYPFAEFREKYEHAAKTVAFKESILRIDEYISDPEKYAINAEPLHAFNDKETTAVNNDEAFNNLRNNEHEDANESLPDLPVKTPKKKKQRASLPSFKHTDIEKPPSKSILVKRTNSKKADSVSPRNAKKRRQTSDLDNNDQDLYTPSHRGNYAAVQLLNRPTLSTNVRPELADIDINNVSQTLKSKNIQPDPNTTFGFLGLGIMGSGIVKNLINSGHRVVVWNRTYNKCRKFEEAGAHIAPTPCDVIDRTDITFSCVSDPSAAKDMVFGNCGILSSTTIANGKGYVEMTGIDSDTSQDIADAVISKGGRYLEAQLQGSKQQADEGTLIVLAAGERSLFDECQSCFEAIGKNSFFLGDVGNAVKMYLVLQLISGINLASLAEGLVLADRAGLQQKDVLEVLELTNISSSMILEKGNAIIKGDYATNHPLLHMQKDLKLALQMSETVEQPLPLTATANEIYKHAKRNGYAEHDSAAVYIRSRI